MKIRTYDALFKRIGDNLQYLRVCKGFTQRELAAMCGTSQVSISHVENAERRPKQELLDKLCLIFNTTLEELILNDYKAQIVFSESQEIDEYAPIHRCSDTIYYCYFYEEKVLDSKDKIQIMNTYTSQIRWFQLSVLHPTSNLAAEIFTQFPGKTKEHKGILEMDGRYAYVTCHEFERDYYLQLCFDYARNKTSKKYSGGLAMMNTLDMSGLLISQFCLITTQSLDENEREKVKKYLKLSKTANREWKDRAFTSEAIVRLTEERNDKVYEWLEKRRESKRGKK